MYYSLLDWAAKIMKLKAVDLKLASGFSAESGDLGSFEFFPSCKA